MSMANLHRLLAPIVAPGALILAEQNGPKPEKPFTTISVRTVDPSLPVVRPPNADGIAEYVQQLYLNVELQFYGVNALERANMVGLRLRTHNNAIRAQQYGISIARINRTLNAPDLLDQTQYEERAILELTAYDSIVTTDDIGLIEGVELACFNHVHLIMKDDA